MDNIIFIILITIFLISFVLFYNSYNQFKKITSKRDVSGYDTALEIERRYDIDSYIIEKKGSFTDTYDNKNKTIKLSSLVFHTNNVYASAMGYFIAMQAVLDKEKDNLFKIKKLFEPLFYVLMTISYIGIILLAFSNLNVTFLVVTLGLCLIYQLVFIKTNLNIINRIKKEFSINDDDLSKALDSLRLLDIAFGVLYIRVLIDKLLELIKNR